MTIQPQNLHQIKDIDLITIEREARAMQARALAEGLVALRRGIASLFARAFHPRTA